MGKLTTLREAILEFVHDGDTVAAEGFSHLVPFAAGHEIIRLERRNLTLVRLSADLIADHDHRGHESLYASHDDRLNATFTIQTTNRVHRPKDQQPAGHLREWTRNFTYSKLYPMRSIISSLEGEWRRYKALGEGAFRQLRDEELGKNGPGEGNSVATLVWHIAGNFNSRFTDFLSSDGEKSWRNRDSEFQPRDGVSRTELLERWNSGWRTLFAALGDLCDDDLSRMVAIRGEKSPAHQALHRLLAHTSYHVGQIVYLAKAFRGAEWNSLSIPPGKSEEYNRNPTREKPPR